MTEREVKGYKNKDGQYLKGIIKREADFNVLFKRDQGLAKVTTASGHFI